MYKPVNIDCVKSIDFPPVFSAPDTVLEKNIWGRCPSNRDADWRAPQAPSRVKYGEECPLLSRLRGLGNVMRSPSGAGNALWRILKAFECSFLYLYAEKIFGEASRKCHAYGKFVTSVVSLSRF